MRAPLHLPTAHPLEFTGLAMWVFWLVEMTQNGVILGGAHFLMDFGCQN
jgi:hypothetical protein